MTTTIVRTGTDVVTLEVLQTGSDETTVVLQKIDALLDGSKNYHFACTELSVPLENCPMHPLTQQFELFSIIRRNVGRSLTEVEFAYTAELALLVAFRLLETGAPGPPVVPPMTDAAMLLFANVAPYTFGLPDPTLRQVMITAIEGHHIAIMYPLGHDLILADARDGIYYLDPGKKFYSPGEFAKDLQAWAHVFNVEQTFSGVAANGLNYGGDAADVIPPVPLPDQATFQDDPNHTYLNPAAGGGQLSIPHKFLQFSLTCDGSLEITGSRQFWNSFVIQMTNYGAALLGLSKSQLQTVIVNPNTGALYTHQIRNKVGDLVNIPTKYISFTNDTTIPFTDPANHNQFIIGNGNQFAHTIAVSTPVYQSSEQRIKVSVGSHLPISSNTQINDGKETVDRDIVEAFFESKIRVEVEYSEQGLFTSSSIRSDVYSGQRNFIKKSDTHTQWMKLMTSYMLKFFRFYLKIQYREFDEVTDSWSLSTKKLSVPEHAYWLMVLKFVSDV